MKYYNLIYYLLNKVNKRPTILVIMMPFALPLPHIISKENYLIYIFYYFIRSLSKCAVLTFFNGSLGTFTCILAKEIQLVRQSIIIFIVILAL